MLSFQNPASAPERLVTPSTFPNPQAPTIKATAAQCEVDGGAFVLTLSDLRPVEPHTHIDRFSEGKSAFVEVGRFMLSPVAFLHLKQQIENAEKWYHAHFGELPDLAKLTEVLASNIPQPEKRETERRLGLRQ
jgi:hypothetical protein